MEHNPTVNDSMAHAERKPGIHSSFPIFICPYEPGSSLRPRIGISETVDVVKSMRRKQLAAIASPGARVVAT